MIMNELNEDFTNLYKRWKGGKVRKEDKIDKEAVLRFIGKYNLDEDKVTIHETCADFDMDVIIDDINDLTFKFGNVSGYFDASYINLKDLKFMPKYVGGDFSIAGNWLESFDGCPEEVGGNFIAIGSGHNLESLKGLPKHIGGYLYITVTGEPDKFTEDDIPEDTVIDGNIRLSIRGKDEM
jgi:hypothetical protein